MLHLRRVSITLAVSAHVMPPRHQPRKLRAVLTSDATDSLLATRKQGARSGDRVLRSVDTLDPGYWTPDEAVNPRRVAAAPGLAATATKFSPRLANDLVVARGRDPAPPFPKERRQKKEDTEEGSGSRVAFQRPGSWLRPPLKPLSLVAARDRHLIAPLRCLGSPLPARVLLPHWQTNMAAMKRQRPLKANFLIYSTGKCDKVFCYSLQIHRMGYKLSA